MPEATATESRAVPSLGLAHFSALELPPSKLAKAAARAGFSAIGLRLHPAFGGSPSYSMRPGGADIKALRRLLETIGVVVHDIEFVAITPEFQPRALLPILEAGAELGARRLSVCGDDHSRARLVQNIRSLCELAAPFGIGVDLENMGWRTVRTFADSYSILADVDHPNAGALLDALHFYRNGGIAQDIRQHPAPLIRSVQLCDARGPAPQANEKKILEARSGRFAPGEGELDLLQFLKAVPADAAISVEVPLPVGLDPCQHIQRLFEATRKLFPLPSD